ncbi:type VI secretion system baseplate subunit TssG [Sabulibacter ruber]|uniref:type VI secretion system baseplate subunit TssG n=1 Tax=Sabulibacter ruber TaxID=2811901 RepID=UPI001A96BC3D|nr:type VI secretion system baseplate subunit TssG [Sabulibacter ruber]
MHNLKNLLAHLPFDMNVEALACSLLETQEELEETDQILVRPLGHVNRRGGREVLNVTGSVFNGKGKELVYLDINRESLFDTLPEMLFFRPEETYEDEVERAQHLALQEQSARRFFLPFEEVLYQTRVELEKAERNSSMDLASCLARIYGLDDLKGVAESQGQMLALVLPFISRFVGKGAETESLLSAFFQKNIAITPARNLGIPIPAHLQTPLGEGLLGEDFLLGDSFTDGIRALHLTVADVLPEEVEQWLPGGQQRVLLEEHLLPYLLPAGETVDFTLEIAGSAWSFLLEDSDDANLNILGYTTKIN